MTTRIGVDLDGVVYDWQGAATYLLNRHQNANLDTSLEWWTDWSTPYEVVGEAAMGWLWQEGVELGLFRYGHILKGAVDGLRALSRFAELHVVTHRPALALRDTLRFVENLPDVFAGVHFLTGEQPKSSVQLDVYIDDAAHVAAEVASEGAFCVLFDQPWNRHQPAELGIVRAAGWENVVKAVRSI